jgi:hypothetical protein
VHRRRVGICGIGSRNPAISRFACSSSSAVMVSKSRRCRRSSSEALSTTSGSSSCVSARIGTFFVNPSASAIRFDVLSGGEFAGAAIGEPCSARSSR